MFYLLTVGLFLGLSLMPVLSTSPQRPTGPAARIVVIKPKEGMKKQFEEGYKRHLEWHRRNNDPWTWYGWDVVAGQRIGYFIDGTFGHRWEDFDAPVSPAADTSDNAVNVAPYGDFVSLSHYVLRGDISRGNLLEDGTRSPLLEIIYYRVRIGKESDFEEVIAKPIICPQRVIRPVATRGIS